MRRHRCARLLVLGAATAAAALYGASAAAQGITLGDTLREALRLNPNIQLQQQQVVASRGAELQALGLFDPLVNAQIGRTRDLRPLRQDEKNALSRGASVATDPLLELFGLAAPATPPRTAPTKQISNTINYSVGVERTLPSGVTVSGDIGVVTTYDNISAINEIPPQTAGRIGFSVRAPLLRNAGVNATTANLSAAQAELAAARSELVFANAQTLLLTTFSYWDYLARTRRLAIARDAESRSARLVDETKKLIDADVVPAADIQLVLASLTERVAARVAAEQAVAEARRNLGLQIGLPAARTADLLPPADDFPRYEGQALAFEPQIGILQELALAQRTDFEAAKHRERASRRRLDLARSGLKPQLDFTLGASYNSLIEDRIPFSTARVLGTSSRVGPSINATLALQLPWNNYGARGNFLVQSAALDSNLVRVRNLSDVIGTSVWLDTQALTRSAEQLVQSIETTRYYRTTVENERTKRRLGLSTLIDVITVEDRLTGALLSEVQAHQLYANAIAQLRFDLGAIVVARGEEFEVPVEDLFSPRFDVSGALLPREGKFDRVLDDLFPSAPGAAQ